MNTESIRQENYLPVLYHEGLLKFLDKPLPTAFDWESDAENIVSNYIQNSMLRIEDRDNDILALELMQQIIELVEIVIPGTVCISPEGTAIQYEEENSVRVCTETCHTICTEVIHATQGVVATVATSQKGTLIEIDRENSIYLLAENNIDKLSKIYTFNNMVEIVEFLLIHDNLISVLFEAHKQIKKVFGDKLTDICLELYIDPVEDFRGLYAIIKTNLSSESSLDLLDKFDDEWWLNINDDVRTILSFIVR